MRHSVLLRWTWLFALGCIASAAHGASLGVNPIRIDLSESAPTAALTLDNSGAGAIVVQLRLMRWTASGESDAYEGSDEIVATPPIMTVRPGQPQIVRVGLSRAPDPERELAYRLFFEEVPPPPTPGYQGVQVALRVGVPVFVSPTKSVRPDLRWRVVRNGGDSVTIHVSNVGSSHAKLTRVSLRGSRPDQVTQPQVIGYLLPGQSRHLDAKFKEALSEKRVRLSAESDVGVTDVDLDVESP
jgi:fimbrial chaperone protein